MWNDVSVVVIRGLEEDTNVAIVEPEGMLGEWEERVNRSLILSVVKDLRSGSVPRLLTEQSFQLRHTSDTLRTLFIAPLRAPLPCLSVPNLPSLNNAYK